jgi:hypothetical protein
MSAVLERSSASRALVMAATRGVANCTLAPGPGLAEFNTAIAARRDQLGQTLALPVSAMPAGRLLRADLAAALRLSLLADRDFARWAGRAEQAVGCPVAVSARSAYLAGLRESALAAQAKERFLGLWDALAARLGQPVFTGRQI